MSSSLRARLLAALLAALASVASGCSDDTHFSDAGSGVDASLDGAYGCFAAGEIVCMGNAARTCNARGELGPSMDCGSQTCVRDMGCRACAPGARSCADDSTPQVCAMDGSGYAPDAPCGGGNVCVDGACVNLCDEARAHSSYLGCEYWTTTLLNAQLGSNPSVPTDLSSPPVGAEGFPFAIAVANPQHVSANVRVLGGALPGVLRREVAPGTLEVIELPWVQQVAQVTTRDTTMRRPGTSAYVPGGGYNIIASVPVTVYQFNPLTFRDARRTGCALSDTTCYSFTNDASLLLPVNVLTGNYTAVSWPSLGSTNDQNPLVGTLSGFVTIVGTADAPTLVTVRLAGGVRDGLGVGPAMPGETLTRILNAGDVWQLASAEFSDTTCHRYDKPFRAGTFVCQQDAAFDLTGSIITADHPVAVFGGHDCAQVPLNRAACDHLEQQLFPSETLGARYFVSRTQPQLPRREPDLVRVVSNRDDNTVTFDPPSVHDPVTLARGQYLDFEQTADFEVRGTGPFVVAQLLVGQNYFGNNTPLPAGTVGDPSMGLEVPVEQWRTSYTVLAPATYTRTFVNVVAHAGATITLDDAPLDVAPTTVGRYDVYRVDISQRTGAHRFATTGSDGFSVKVYGFGPYTSYMYPGGLDLARISPPS